MKKKIAFDTKKDKESFALGQLLDYINKFEGLLWQKSDFSYFDEEKEKGAFPTYNGPDFVSNQREIGIEVTEGITTCYGKRRHKLKSNPKSNGTWLYDIQDTDNFINMILDIIVEKCDKVTHYVITNNIYLMIYNVTSILDSDDLIHRIQDRICSLNLMNYDRIYIGFLNYKVQLIYQTENR